MLLGLQVCWLCFILTVALLLIYFGTNSLVVLHLVNHYVVLIDLFHHDLFAAFRNVASCVILNLLCRFVSSVPVQE